MLRVNGIDAYYGDLQALWDVSFDVEEGEIVILIGSNGAGKSTCVRTISGLLRPKNGSIEFLGKRIDGAAPHQVVELGIAHVPEGRRLFPLMTVQENLELGSYRAAAKKKRAASLKRVFEIFPILYERRTQVAVTLSGGQQQMVAIGRGLMADPKLLLLDEPCLGLAPMLVREIFTVIEDIRAAGVAVLLVEQTVDHALKFEDRAYVLENGRIVLKGKGHDLLQDQHLQRAYLGVT